VGPKADPGNAKLPRGRRPRGSHDRHEWDGSGFRFSRNRSIVYSRRSALPSRIPALGTSAAAMLPGLVKVYVRFVAPSSATSDGLTAMSRIMPVLLSFSIARYRGGVKRPRDACRIRPRGTCARGDSANDPGASRCVRENAPPRRGWPVSGHPQETPTTGRSGRRAVVSAT